MKREKKKKGEYYKTSLQREGVYIDFFKNLKFTHSNKREKDTWEALNVVSESPQMHETQFACYSPSVDRTSLGGPTYEKGLWSPYHIHNAFY